MYCCAYLLVTRLGTTWVKRNEAYRLSLMILPMRAHVSDDIFPMLGNASKRAS